MTDQANADNGAAAVDTTATATSATGAAATGAAATGAAATGAAATGAAATGAAATGAAAATASDAAAQAAIAWPEEWRDALAKGDTARKSVLSRLATPEAMADKLFEQEKLIRERATVKPFPADGTPEQQAQWKEANGVPGEIAGYDIDKLEGVVVGDMDRPVLEGFLGKMLADNTPKPVVNKVVSAYYELQSQEAEKWATTDADAARDAIAAMKTEFGGDYDYNTNRLTDFFKTYGEGVLEPWLQARLPDGRLLGNDVGTLKAMLALADVVKPPVSTPAGGAGVSGGKSRLDEITAIRRSDPDKYYADKAMQAEELALLAKVK